jgi:hypothetical protein
LGINAYCCLNLLLLGDEMLAYILPVEVEVGPGEDGVVSLVSLVAVVVLVAVVDVDDSVGDGTGTGAGDCNDIDVVG